MLNRDEKNEIVSISDTWFVEDVIDVLDELVTPEEAKQLMQKVAETFDPRHGLTAEVFMHTHKLKEAKRKETHNMNTFLSSLGYSEAQIAEICKDGCISSTPEIKPEKDLPKQERLVDLIDHSFKSSVIYTDYTLDVGYHHIHSVSQIVAYLVQLGYKDCVHTMHTKTLVISNNTGEITNGVTSLRVQVPTSNFNNFIDAVILDRILAPNLSLAFQNRVDSRRTQVVSILDRNFSSVSWLSGLNTLKIRDGEVIDNLRDLDIGAFVCISEMFKDGIIMLTQK